MPTFVYWNVWKIKCLKKNVWGENFNLESFQGLNVIIVKKLILCSPQSSKNYYISIFCSIVYENANFYLKFLSKSFKILHFLKKFYSEFHFLKISRSI